MSAFTNSTIHALLDWVTGKTTPAAVATRYITVFNGDPSSGGTEVLNAISGSSNRIDMTTAMAAASGGMAVSNADVVFTASASGAAAVTWVAVYSAITGGTLMAKGQVTPKNVEIGDSLAILSGALTMSIS